MVSIKYPAIYSDDLGCDKCYVYLSQNDIQLKIRGFKFLSENYDFDFYCSNKIEARKYFYLKDDELINYVLDIRIKIPIVYKNKQHIEKAILRIERQKNYYNNKIIIDTKDKKYEVTGFNLKNILYNLQKNFPKEYSIDSESVSLLSF